MAVALITRFRLHVAHWADRLRFVGDNDVTIGPPAPRCCENSAQTGSRAHTT